MRTSASGFPRRPLPAATVINNLPRQPITRGRIRNACFTLNNPTDDEKNTLTNYIDQLPEDIRYLVFQEEQASTGTNHIQGYVEFNRRLTFNVAKTLLCADRRVHLEKRRGTPAQASDYCKKLDSRLEGGISGEVGEISYSRPDKLKNVILALSEGKTVKDIQDEFPTQYFLFKDKISANFIERKGKRHLTPSLNNVHIYVGPSGSGKSTTAWRDYPDAFKGVWPTGSRWWWPNYKGEQTAIFDEFRENLSYQQALALFDIHPMSIEYKGGNTENVCERIIITTIRDPKEWYKNVQDKTELQRRIQQNATIYDFNPTAAYPNFIKTARTDVFSFDDPAPANDELNFFN